MPRTSGTGSPGCRCRSALYDIGLEGAQIEDKVPLTAFEKEQMFVDILPDMQDDDGIAYLSFFVEKTEDGTI